MRKRIILIVLLTLIFIPLTKANAKTRTEEVVDELTELAESFDGTVTYENNNLEIEWFTQNSQYQEYSIGYNGNVVEYRVDEVNSYDEAEDVFSHTFYAIYLMQAVLRLNGYTEEEILTYLSSDELNLDFDINGIELLEFGEEQEFISDDESSTITVSPISIKIDVTRANLNTATDDPFVPTTNTVRSVVEYLQSDTDFTTGEYEGVLTFENSVSLNEDEGEITVAHTDYWQDYHNVTFYIEDDILTYDFEQVESYADAEIAGSHQLFLTQILSIALRLNGYTTEEISNFYSSEDSNPTYDRNGIELVFLGDTQEFTSEDGSSTIYYTPMSARIDLVRANIGKYKVIDGANQTINSDQELTFKFNIDYSKFTQEGKVYINGELVDSSNYTSSEGSTIITFNADYVKNLPEAEYNLKITVADGEVETKFVIDNNTIPNPKTGDNVIIYISLFGVSILALVGLGLYTRKKKEN